MKKLRSRGGMTLTELLCAVVIVLLISGLLAVGVRFSVRAYQRSMAASQAQVLSSTLTAAISDKLRYCGSVSPDGDQIFIRDMGSVEGDEKGEVFRVSADGELLLGENKLLGSRAYPQGLQVEDFHMEYDSTGGIFRVSFRIADSGGTELAAAEFEVKRVNSGTV